MRKLILIVAVLMAIPTVSEAGVFRKRNGERRAPVRNVLKGGCGLFGCGR